MKKILTALLFMMISASPAQSADTVLATSPAGTMTATGLTTDAYSNWLIPNPIGTIKNPQVDLAPGYAGGLAITGSGLTAGQVYYRGVSALALAQADSDATMPAACIAISSTQCLFSGIYRFAADQAWTVGGKLYLSDSTAGALTQSQPSTRIQTVGIAVASDAVLITPIFEAPAGGGYATIQDETTPLTQRATVNFTGAGVTCVDNAGATRTDCTITSGGLSNVVEDLTPQLGGDLDMNSNNITAAGPTTISPTEMSYLDGVTSSIQTQFSGKANTSHTQAESTITFTDITTGNATVSVHGYLPKLGGGTTNFLRADGTWAAPAGGGTITDVWACTTGNCNAITAAAGDSLNASAADSSIPFKTGPTANLPATCSPGMTYWATDAPYAYSICTSTNVWSPVWALGSDGSYYLELNSNTSYTPASGKYRYLFVGGSPKIDSNGTAYSLVQSPVTGPVTFTGPTAPRSYAIADAAATILTTNAAVTPAQGGTGVANGANNTITFTGNYTFGLTLSGNTAVTLPTSGTLATLGANTFTGTQALGANNLTMTGSLAATGARVTKGWFTDVESTNMPTVGGTAILTSLTAPQFTTIELGAASDTTLARSGAGVITVEGVTVTRTIASGTSALGTAEIASGACATAVTTSATGVATTDVIDWGFNGDPTGVTGYAPSANGMLTIIAYPSANNVNYKVCNNTASAVTPGAITLNWKVTR